MSGDITAMKEVPHIHHLPDEVLEKIFSFINTNYMVVRVLPVCQRWKDVAGSRILSKELVFCLYTIRREEALRLIDAAPNLQSLEVSFRDDAVPILEAASARCAKLNRLLVGFLHGRSTALSRVLRDIIRNCPLTDLTLVDVHVTDGLELCRDLGASLPGLQKLHINDCVWFNSPELDALLENCSVMQSFSASIWACSDENADKLAQRWGDTLKELEVNASELSDAGLACLSSCSKLQSLKLRYLSHPGDGLHHFTALTKLYDLNLSNAREVKSDTWCRFFSQCRSGRRLRKVSLSGCRNVDNGVLYALAVACPALEKLNISSSWCYTQTGVRVVLERCRKLRQLKVFETDPSVAELVPNLPELAPQLQKIRIGTDARRSLGLGTLMLVQTKMRDLKIGVGKAGHWQGRA